MLSGGRTAFISLLLVFSFFMLKFLLEERTSHKLLVFIIVCFLTLSLFAVNSIEYWNELWSVESDYWDREALWRSALKANPFPLFGVGTGDDRMVLNDYYIGHGLEEFAKNNFNSHNQFIQIYFSNGLLGLVAVALILIRPLYVALRSENTPGVLIIFPFFIYGMTEVFLGRYQGVVFFAVLHQLLISRYYIGAPDRTLKVD
jgi:O-antigen ligase